jgi:hypothetical protein
MMQTSACPPKKIWREREQQERKKCTYSSQAYIIIIRNLISNLLTKEHQIIIATRDSPRLHVHQKALELSHLLVATTKRPRYLMPFPGLNGVPPIYTPAGARNIYLVAWLSNVQTTLVNSASPCS